MAKKLYVGNISYRATEEDLKETFEKIGEVQSVKIITDASTGRSRGYGFVEMASDEDADKAIASLNGATLTDRAIVVNEARPPADNRRGGGPGRGPAGRGKGFGSRRQGRF